LLRGNRRFPGTERRGRHFGFHRMKCTVRGRR
jgi:hypothetical protein